MTNDRNDRRRRPQTGPGRKPASPSGSNWRGNSPQQPSRNPAKPESPRRGFTPDSGYRPGGAQPTDAQRGRQWNPNERGRTGGSSPNAPRGQGSGGRPQGSPRPGPGRSDYRGQPQGPRDSYPPRRPGSAPTGQGQGPRYRDAERSRTGDERNRPTDPGRRPAGYGDSRGPRPPVERGRSETFDRPAPRPPESGGRSGKVDPFDLFCAYHLGITADKKFRHMNINDVARRFNVGPGEIKQALQDFGMDAAVVMEKEFDMALAQLDIELAPEGIDRVELARQIYTDYLEAPRRKIDWKKIIEDDIRENAKIFGRKD